MGIGLRAILLIQRWAKEEGPVNEKQNKSSKEQGHPERKTKKNQEGKEGDTLFSDLLTQLCSKQVFRDGATVSWMLGTQ